MDFDPHDARLQLAMLTYPLAPAIQLELIGLLRTEWTRTDYDWLEAMNGKHSEHLVITTALVRLDGEAVATATIHFSRHQPEIAVMGNVLTHPDRRGLGLAGRVVTAALDHAQRAGCQVCLLGTGRKPRNVYQQHGFAWLSGVVMRRSFGGPDFEAGYFAGAQPAQVRPAHWGDLPGLSLLVVQPLATVCLDFPRALCSSRHVDLIRCLSNFPLLWSETAERTGLLSVLAAPQSGRIFGFGTMTRTPGPVRKHTAVIDFAAHDHYVSHQASLVTHLLDGCQAQEIRYVQAYVAVGDEAKLACLHSAGFTEQARLPDALNLDRETRDALLLGRKM